MSKILLILLGGFLCTSSSQAQHKTTLDTLKLETIIVTASKIPTSIRETTRPVVVIDQQSIQRNAGKDLSQLLNQYSGMNVNGAFSNPGKDKAAYLQGAALKYSLILVDGMPVNDPSGPGGMIDLRVFPLNTIERIEIVKGGMSTLYGTDAIAGVVNIITKKASEKKIQVAGIGAYGSNESYTGSLSLSGSAEMVSYSLSYINEGSAGVSEATDPDQTDDVNFLKDGFSRDVFSAKTTLSFGDTFQITPFVNSSGFEGDYDDGSFTDAENTYDIEVFNPGVNLNYQSDDFNLRGGYSYTQTDRSFDSAFGLFEGKGRLHNADLYTTDQLSDRSRFIVGLNYQHSLLDEDDILTGRKDPYVEIISPYFSLLMSEWSSLKVELGLRMNHHSEYGTNLTYSFAPSFRINDDLRFLSSLSTGFRAPTLNELFGPFGGNDDLSPETSLSFDFGVEAQFLDGRLATKALYFNRTIDELILYNFANGYLNVGDEQTQGFEFSSKWILNSATSLEAFYNYLDFDEVAYRRPKHSVGAAISMQPVEALNLRINGSYQGKRTDIWFTPAFTQEDVLMDAFMLVNVYAEYAFEKYGVKVFVDFNNLLNSDYSEVYGYNTLGFNMKSGVKFSF